MNNIIATIGINTKADEIVFFLRTDNKPQIWYWVVDSNYYLSRPSTENDTDFVNNPQNETIGYSVGVFDTLKDAENDYFNGGEI